MHAYTNYYTRYTIDVILYSFTFVRDGEEFKKRPVTDIQKIHHIGTSFCFILVVIYLFYREKSLI